MRAASRSDSESMNLKGERDERVRYGVEWRKKDWMGLAFENGQPEVQIRHREDHITSNTNIKHQHHRRRIETCEVKDQLTW